MECSRLRSIPEDWTAASWITNLNRPTVVLACAWYSQDFASKYCNLRPDIVPNYGTTCYDYNIWQLYNVCSQLSGINQNQSRLTSFLWLEFVIEFYIHSLLGVHWSMHILPCSKPARQSTSSYVDHRMSELISLSLTKSSGVDDFRQRSSKQDLNT